MQRLSDEELKAAIEKGFADAEYILVEADTQALFNAIRGAERGKGEDGFVCPTCHGNMAVWPCEDCGSTGRIVYPKSTPYADKVLEVSTRLAVSWASSFNAPASGLESRVQY